MTEQPNDEDALDMAIVVITCDHVYLPLDENGDGTFDWAGVQRFDHQG